LTFPTFNVSLMGLSWREEFDAKGVELPKPALLLTIPVD
jgi:hypothetical protein